jgi:hypothetical protein
MIQGKNLIPRFRWTTGMTTQETETGVPKNKWVWKIAILGTDQNGQDIVKETMESIYLSPKPKFYNTELEADRGAEKFVDEELIPRFQDAYNKVLRKNWGLR